MKDISKYSVNNLLNEYFKNKELINSYVSGQNIENFSHNNDRRGMGVGLQVGGMGLQAFVSLCSVITVLWLIGLYLTYTLWNRLPDWGKLLCVFGLVPALPGGPLLTIIIALITKKD